MRAQLVFRAASQTAGSAESKLRKRVEDCVTVKARNAVTTVKQVPARASVCPGPTVLTLVTSCLP